MTSETVRWIPKADEASNASKSVSAIYFAASEPQNQSTVGPIYENIRKTNHWTISLAIPGKHSVRLDPTPEPPSMAMILLASGNDNDFIESAHKVVCLTPAKGFTVSDFLGLLKAYKYDRYTFTSEGTGCRYWLHCVVQLLQKTGNVANGLEVNAANMALDSVWEDDQLAKSGQQTTIDSRKGIFSEPRQYADVNTKELCDKM